MRIEDFLSKLNKVTPDGDKRWKACCPAHEDKTPSMSVKLADDGKILVKCFAGCDTGDVLNALSLEIKDLMPVKSKIAKKPRKARATIIAYYDYVDAAGKLLFQVCRKSDKSFSQRIPDPAKPGKWKWGRSRYDVPATIYRLDKVLSQIASGRAVYIAEGEKDVETLEKLGLVATCNCGGAGQGKWEARFSDYFKHCKAVVILADNDPGPDEVKALKKYWQGQKHALLIQESLKAAGVQNIKVMTMPEIDGQKVKDISDWVELGGDLKQFKASVRTAPPLSPEKYLDSDTFETNKNKPEEADADISPDQPLWKQIGIALYEATTVDDGNEAKRLTQTERQKIITRTIFEWLRLRGKFFYHSELEDHASSMYFDSKTKILRLIDSNQFCSWLARESKVNRTDKSFAHCIAHLHDMALSEEFSRGVVPAKFFERVKDCIYISCGDTHIVRISAKGVSKVDNGTDNVVFNVGQTLAPWRVVPIANAVDPFTHCSLFSGMATSDPAGKLLTQLWLFGVLYDHVAKPPIIFTGGVGSGKTRTAKGIYELLGIPARITTITEKLEEDFWVSLDQGGLVCWDNADTRIRWLADALASASTAGSHEVRKKYSDSEMIKHQARANVIVTSANATFAGDPGLADRLIVVRLLRNTRETAESRLSREIAIHRDASLTWLCDILHKALSDTADVPSGLNWRHPDWAEFAVRCGRAMNLEGDTLAALRSAEVDKSMFAIENDFYGSLLLQLIPKEGVEMTSTELCEMIKESADLDERTKKDISPRKLGIRINKLWPHVEQVFSGRITVHTRGNLYSLVGLSDNALKQSNKNNQPELFTTESDHQHKKKIAKQIKEELKTLPPDEIDDLDWIDEALEDVSNE